MPQSIIPDNSRIALRIPTTEKALLLRAVALEHTTLTHFILKNALQAAQTVVDQSEHIILSHKDSLQVLDLLENPPAPNDKLLAAAKALSISS